ncbi:hypothetical protein Q4485_01920 [Granulosicoccaceae sp. 1_MG-2023]|nr:hypothetical protein [Granulosicoccaceae sp. 1_MG-2023]
MTDTALPRSKPGPLAWLTALIMALVVGLGLLQLWRLVNPPRAETAALNPACDLHSGPCTATFSDGSQLTLSISPQPIVQQEPLTLQVRISGLTVDSMQADIVGIGMNMGYNRPALTARPDGHFSGRAILPVCVLTEMPWEIRLMAQTPDRGLLVAPFRFTTSKRQG